MAAYTVTENIATLFATDNLDRAIEWAQKYADDLAKGNRRQATPHLIIETWDTPDDIRALHIYAGKPITGPECTCGPINKSHKAGTQIGYHSVTCPFVQGDITHLSRNFF